MKRFSLLRLILVLGCVAAFSIACSRDPNVRKQKYFESGQRYFEKGKFREAVIQYRNATEVDGAFAAAHYQLAQSYEKLQDWQRAYVELNRTIELQPDNYKAHVDMANLLIAAGQREQLQAAQEHVDLLLEKDPTNPDAHMAAGNLLAHQQKYSEAIDEIKKAIALAPDHGSYYLSLAILQAKSNQLAEAEQNYKKAIELKAPQAGLALAAFYQSRGRYADAEQQVQQAIAANPKDTTARAELVRVYMSEGKKSEAENFLKQVKQEFPDNSAGYRMLGDFYFATGDMDKALAEYESLYHDHSKDPVVERNYVQLLILKDRMDDAEKINNSFLKAHPADAENLTYRGEIQMRRGNASQAVQTLQSVVVKNPDMAVAHYQLGMALNASGDMDRAASEWRDAVRINPNMVDAYRYLAAYAVRKNDMSGLEDAATKIIALQPASPDGYSLRAMSYIQRKQFSSAEQDARKAIEVAPQSPGGYQTMGNLRTVQHNFSDAESWYKQALNHNPSSADALQGLLNLYLLQNQPDKAIAAANQQIALSPNNAAFYDLLGSILLNKKDFAGAQDAFKKSISISKSNPDAYAKLAQAQAASGALDDALATCNEALQHSKTYAVYMLMGSIYEKKNDLPKAQSAYESALQAKPDDPLASNNLAYIMLETNSNPDQALNYAQTARRGLPQVSAVADTLGWAFYQKGIYSSAINMFEDAIKLAAKNKEPENATYHYHLGLAYEKSEQPALARQHLERVLKIDPNYSEAADVKKQLAQLKS